MSQLREIALFQFKNYPEKRLTFSKRIIGFTGKNGVGKTNLLDAIHYLGLTKSYFGKTDLQSVHFGQQGFRIQGLFEKNGKTDEVSCVYRENGKKEISINGNTLPRNTEHIGQYTIVFIAPDDIQLITGESRDRRVFIDQLISQLDTSYLHHLLSYNRLLQQRNALLKEMAVKRLFEDPLLDVLDQQLVPYGLLIFDKRKKILEELIQLAKGIYQHLAISPEKMDTESIGLVYKSELEKIGFSELLKMSRSKDLYLQRTTKGVHRDDLECLFQDHPFKQIASQGQRKSLLFSLKLAALQLLDNYNSNPPLLLLDDFFEKLDDSRIENLLQLVCNQVRSQVFLSHTSSEKLHFHLKKINVPYEIFEITGT